LAQAEKNLVAANAGITAAQQQVQQLPKRVTDLAAAEKATQAELVTAQNELKQIEAEILNLKGQLQRSQAALASNSTSPKK